jgi:hypothetical protein
MALRPNGRTHSKNERTRSKIPSWNERNHSKYERRFRHGMKEATQNMKKDPIMEWKNPLQGLE